MGMFDARRRRFTRCREYAKNRVTHGRLRQIGRNACTQLPRFGRRSHNQGIPHAAGRKNGRNSLAHGLRSGGKDFRSAPAFPCKRGFRDIGCTGEKTIMLTTLRGYIGVSENDAVSKPRTAATHKISLYKIFKPRRMDASRESGTRSQHPSALKRGPERDQPQIGDRATRSIGSALPILLHAPLPICRMSAARDHLMTVEIRLYRGLEIYPLVFSHRPAGASPGHNHDDGFDAAVRIQEPPAATGISRSRVFKVSTDEPFQSAGDARRASIAYAEQTIDTSPQARTFLD